MVCSESQPMKRVQHSPKEQADQLNHQHLIKRISSHSNLDRFLLNYIRNWKEHKTVDCKYCKLLQTEQFRYNFSGGSNRSISRAEEQPAWERENEVRCRGKIESLRSLYNVTFIHIIGRFPLQATVGKGQCGNNKIPSIYLPCKNHSSIFTVCAKGHPHY